MKAYGYISIYEPSFWTILAYAGIRAKILRASAPREAKGAVVKKLSLKSCHAMASPSRLDDPYLEKLVCLLKRYEPERIILFGSRARGDADEYSDYDIIVIKRTDKPFLERLRDMVPYLVKFDRPAEVLVYTPEEFERMRDIGLGWIVHNEGVVLYERS